MKAEERARAIATILLGDHPLSSLDVTPEEEEAFIALATRAIVNVVLEEREGCAKVCEDTYRFYGHYHAKRIRARE